MGLTFKLTEVIEEFIHAYEPGNKNWTTVDLDYLSLYPDERDIMIDLNEILSPYAPSVTFNVEDDILVLYFDSSALERKYRARIVESRRDKAEREEEWREGRGN